VIYFSNRTFLLAKRETAYGTAPTPGATDLIEAYDLSITPTVETVTRIVNRNSFSPVQPRVGKAKTEVSFKVPLWHYRTGSVLPRYLTLLKGCGLIKSGTTIVKLNFSSLQPPQINGPDSLSFIVLNNVDASGEGYYTEVSGAVGSAKFVLVNGELPYIEFTFTGLYDTPKPWNDSITWAGSEEAIEERVYLSEQSSFYKDGYGGTTILTGIPPHVGFEIDLANNIVEREDATGANGYAGFVIAGREPKVTFSPEYDNHQVGVNENWHDLLYTEEPLKLVASFTDGRCSLACFFGLTEIGTGDRNGIMTYEITGSLWGNEGDDEFEMTMAAS
jgi:hypothetical protein